MPRDAVSRTANVERTGWHKWVNLAVLIVVIRRRGLSLGESIIFPSQTKWRTPGYFFPGERKLLATLGVMGDEFGDPLKTPYKSR